MAKKINHKIWSYKVSEGEQQYEIYDIYFQRYLSTNMHIPSF